MEGSPRGHAWHAWHAGHTEVVPRSKDIAQSSTMGVARRRGMMPSACSIQVVARIVAMRGERNGVAQGEVVGAYDQERRGGGKRHLPAEPRATPGRSHPPFSADPLAV